MNATTIYFTLATYSATLQKTGIYSTFKNESTSSYYLDLTRKITNRKALVKLCIGNYKLMIESGQEPVVW